MYGKFYYTNSKIFAITLFAGIFGGGYLCVISGLDAKGSAMFIGPLMLIIGMLLSKIPCTYRINGEKLILRNGLIVRKLDISEIRGVNIDMRKSGYNRSGGTYFQTVLKIYSGGEEILLREDRGLIKMEDIMHDPHFIHETMRRSELNKLADYLRRVI